MERTSQAEKVDFSVGIPICDEEAILLENTSRLCQYLEELGVYEVIIVSNGSADRSVEIGRQLAAHNARVRFFEIRQRNVAEAFQIMLGEARSDFLISLDMDLSAHLEFVEEALRLLHSHDLVVGSKKLGSQKRSFIRKVGSDLYIRCARRLLQLGVDDYSMGAKAYRVSFFERFKGQLGNGTCYVVNALYLARWNGGRIVQIPVSCHDLRRSRFNLAYEALHKFAHLFHLWLKHVWTQGKVPPPD
ncbi:MAG: glycosyltransferase family 2 protein [Acidobacteriota bacterium]